MDLLLPSWEEDEDEGAHAGWLLEDFRGTAYSLGLAVFALQGGAEPVAALRLGVEVGEIATDPTWAEGETQGAGETIHGPRPRPWPFRFGSAGRRVTLAT